MKGYQETMLKRKEKKERDKRKNQCGRMRMKTLCGQSLNTELRLEAYRTLYPQYIPASSIGLEDETIPRGISR